MGHDRLFIIALTISAIIHLSMVSVFSIGVWFPREERVYHHFDIVEDPTGRLLFQELRARRGIAGVNADDLLRGQSSEDVIVPSLRRRLANLPQVELAPIDVPDLERLQLRREAIDARSRLEEYRTAQINDSWSRFGQGIERFTDTVRNLNPFEAEEEEPEGDQAAPGPRLIGDPAPGFKAYVEWITGEPDREILLARPIEALRGIDPEEWPRSVPFVIKVSPEGKVVEMLVPPSLDRSLMVRVGQAISKYRFESAVGESIQHGTVLITAAEDAVEDDLF